MNPDTSRTDEQPTEERPVSRRGRLSRSMPIMVGAVIAAMDTRIAALSERLLQERIAASVRSGRSSPAARALQDRLVDLQDQATRLSVQAAITAHRIADSLQIGLGIGPKALRFAVRSASAGR